MFAYLHSEAEVPFTKSSGSILTKSLGIEKSSCVVNPCDCRHAWKVVYLKTGQCKIILYHVNSLFIVSAKQKAV